MRRRFNAFMVVTLSALGGFSCRGAAPEAKAPQSQAKAAEAPTAPTTPSVEFTAGRSPASGTAGTPSAPLEPTITQPSDQPAEPGAVADPGPPLVGDAARVRALLDDAKKVDASGLASKRHVPFRTELGYDPLAAQGFELLQSSSLGLNESEQALLREHGFALLARHEFPSFFYAYVTIYAEDLPVFVSADSVLDALHRSYDDILAALERTELHDQLLRVVTGMRAGLAGRADESAADAELFLAVGEALLSGAVPAILHAGVNDGDVRELYDGASAGAGAGTVTLFGSARIVDYTQFVPRGHYERDPRLQRYFRAMMWFGRTDLRLIETLADGSQRFDRRQLEAALLLRSLMTDEVRASWQRIDAIVTAFVGEHDSMVVSELDALLADLKVTELDDTIGDQQIIDAIVAGGYGAQRINSQIMVNGGDVASLPLARSFALFGQRYTVDSHVFSNLVYDRVGRGAIDRWLPDPLDAAYAALGNDHAVSLLQGELARFPYAPDLEVMRVLVDDHPESYWESSLYTLWLSALRTLSPSSPEARPDASGLPSVATREAWGRRVLNTQLGSWSQLRHDTLLYAKQSYSTATACEFPDAYVDPYPELFAALGRLAMRGHDLLAATDLGTTRTSPWGDPRSYFMSLAETMSVLEAMAQAQRTGMPHNAEHLAFVNEVVDASKLGSGAPSFQGWYPRLFHNREQALEKDPIIADVHSDPGGQQRPASVLHVATGLPRAMVVTVDTCTGPRLYIGPAFAYHEKRTSGLTRITDSAWSAETAATPRPPDVSWLQPVIAR